ncbi:MAG: hypothetical protein HKN12_03935 [Gemmatimonadetes bacterium]|nr:hypothetical protein [Gemmatimonadota bacterium]
MTPSKMRKLLVCAPLAMALAFAGGCSDESDNSIVPNNVDTTPPGVPANLVVSGSPQSGIAVDWQANSEPDLAGYMVQRSLDRGVTWQNVTATPLTSAAFADSYRPRADYRVAAMDQSDNQSAFSGSRAYIYISSPGGKNPSTPLEP